MKKIFTLLLFVSLAVLGFGQNTSVNSLVFTPYTVSTLPTASTNAQRIFLVTDGTTSIDCTTGGGSIKVLCQSSGSSYSALISAGSAVISGQTTGQIPLPGSGTTITNTLAAGTNRGTYVVSRPNTTQGTAAALVEAQDGACTRSVSGTTTDTVLYSDVLPCTIFHARADTNAVTETIPTPTTLNNSNAAFIYENDSNQTDTLTPTTWTIALGHSAAASTLNVPSNVKCTIQIDPSVSTTWDAVCTPNALTVALSAVSGSAAQATGTEGAAGDNYTFAGVETGNLTAYLSFVNTNSTNNNTSLGFLAGAAGTSTGGIGGVIFDISGTGDIFRMYSGGSINNGVYTPGTLEAHFTAGGALGLGTSTCVTFGSAGGICPAEGTAPTNVSGAAPLYPDATAHEYLAAMNGSSSFGMMVRRQPGAIHATAQTAAISTATLCAASAGACNVAGQYHIHWNFTQGGTACTVVTAGSVTFLLTWTDTNAVSHSAIAMPMFNSVSNIATSGSFTFTTSNATAYASGDFNISTNGSVIQYATGYTACTTGTGTYQLDAVVTRLQ
jgi:hypothetical protein